MVYCREYFLNGNENLFATSEIKGPNSYLHHYESWDYFVIIGYKHAVDSIIEYFKSNQSKLPSLHISVLYPLAYLHRHQIELRLKYIYKLYCSIYENDKERKGHDLLSIWKECRIKLITYFDKKYIVSDCFLDFVENIIRQLHIVDPDGQRFRYSITSNGKKSLEFKNINEEGYIVIDIINFHNTLIKLEQSLEIISQWLMEDYAEKITLTPDLP